MAFEIDPEAVAWLKEMSERIRSEHLTPQPWPQVDESYSVAAEGYFNDLHFIVMKCDTTMRMRPILRHFRSVVGAELYPELYPVNGCSELHYNGYVELPASHPDFGKCYDDIEVEVHGGLTFCQLTDKGTFWVGFDTCHLADENNWPLDRVKSETKALAAQLAEKMK